jgi:hypothetical protein
MGHRASRAGSQTASEIRANPPLARHAKPLGDSRYRQQGAETSWFGPRRFDLAYPPGPRGTGRPLHPFGQAENRFCPRRQIVRNSGYLDDDVPSDRTRENDRLVQDALLVHTVARSRNGEFSRAPSEGENSVDGRRRQSQSSEALGSAPSAENCTGMPGFTRLPAAAACLCDQCRRRRQVSSWHRAGTAHRALD